ncbi:hypothetical protein ACH46N_04295 [Streptomyces pristinaespiralis]|uniref:hypothetical protein n=1 Tax=Streptomyces pristinaespiralis TaxID=38300 RepID=UPI001319D1BE|nr:hypothetical protein [Streptomyces pristinaespiralis]QMU17721.1 hypothetical protein H3L99_32465 [Streptomyces pristinaespiralis]
MRLRRGRKGLTGLAMLSVLTMTATTGCGALLLEDKGPLPPRYSGPPLPADTVVSDLTSALKAEGITLERTPQELIPTECHERLTGEHESATADTAVQAGFDRARSDHGWQSGREMGEGWLVLRKGNWTAATVLPGASGADATPTSLIVITLMCDGGRSKSSPTDSARPSPAAS